MNGENSEAPPQDPFRARLVEILSDRYELGAEIGRGGMGIVYRAVDRRLQRTVALKLLPPELAFRADIKSRFLREAISAAQLSHPNIVPIYSVDEYDGLVFFAMGFVDGENLGDAITREKRMSHARSRLIMSEVADALAFAHERGVVHRDIKADNIIIDGATQRPMVTDFGIARAISDIGDTKLTATGVAIGTPAYMSPEQCVGDREIDGRSDLYSLGVVGYQMVSGRTPFEATSTPAMLIKQFSEVPQDIRALRPDTPPDLANIIMRLLEKKPENRFESGRVLVAALSGEIPVGAVPRRLASPNVTAAPSAPVGARTQPPPYYRPPEHDGRVRRREKFRDKPLGERVRIVRGEAFRVFGTSVFLMCINLITSPRFPWFFFPTLGMSLGLWGKLSGLWADGLRWRDVFGSGAQRLMAGGEVRGALEEVGGEQNGIPKQAAATVEDPMWKHAPRELLESEYGPVVRQAISDHEGIKQQVERLSVADRGLIPDVLPTAKALFDRGILLGGALASLDRDLEGSNMHLLDERIAAAEREEARPTGGAGDRKLALLRKQRNSLQGLVDSRTEMQSQFESAALMLRNLALDVLKLRSAGIQSVLGDVNSATQEARALVLEIGHVIGAAEELRSMETKSRRE